MFVTSMSAAEKLSIKDITSGKFAAKTVNGINPIEGTDTYARISDDGKRVESYSFKTGKKIATLFDVDNTMGKKIKDFDGYILSPDGTRMLIQTETERIYRRSFRATYYIYTMLRASWRAFRTATSSRCRYGRTTDCRWRSCATITSSS